MTDSTPTFHAAAPPTAARSSDRVGPASRAEARPAAPQDTSGWRRTATWGVVFGAGSAVGYALANAFLRQVASDPPIWVAAMKAALTAAPFLPWWIYLIRRGRRVLPPAGTLWMLAAVAVGVQFFGNVFYQYSLGQIGLALTVPVNMGTMILGGALLGRIIMGEPLSWKITAGLLVLIASIAMFSLGGEHDAGWGLAPEPRSWLAGVLASCVSGLAYSGLGLAIRQSMKFDIPLATPIIFVAVAGTVALPLASLVWEGMDRIAAIPAGNWWVMVVAGLLNGAAFLSLTKSLQLLPVVYVNGVNAATILFSTTIALVWFHEPWTASLGFGLLTMLAGLTYLAYAAADHRRAQLRGRPLPRP